MCVHVVGGVRVRVGARARCVYAVSGAPGYQATGGGGGAIRQYREYTCTVPCRGMYAPHLSDAHRCRVRARARPRARPRVSCFTDYSWLHILMHAS